MGDKTGFLRLGHIFTIFVLELWDSSTRQLTDYHRVLHGDEHGDENTGN